MERFSSTFDSSENLRVGRELAGAVRGNLGTHRQEDWVSIVNEAKRFHHKHFGTLAGVKTRTGAPVPLTPARSILDMVQWWFTEAERVDLGFLGRKRLACISNLRALEGRAFEDVEIALETENIADFVEQALSESEKLLLPVGPDTAADFWSEMSACTLVLSAEAELDKAPGPLELMAVVLIESSDPGEVVTNLKKGADQVLDAAKKAAEEAAKNLSDIVLAGIKGLLPVVLIAGGGLILLASARG